MLTRLEAALADRYRIERELGAGGMATVYLAHDVRHGRPVAVKVLRPELAAIIGADRFLKEIETTANLQHPHILPLFDSGAADSFLFYVMPYVQGESLRDRLTREKQLPVDDGVRLAIEVASALDYAHRRGIIHRDIKPENILLHDGRAVVADFGIALAVTSADGQRLTGTGMSLGTPHYMSPEQAMGDREISPKSDVYALGCVLYELLLGEPPFTGPTAQSIIVRVMMEEPRSPTLQRKSIPPYVERALLTALAKLPADRFASAAQFAEALQGRAIGIPVGVAATEPVIGVAPAAYRRRSRLIVGACLVASALVAGAGAWAWFSSRGGEPPQPVRFVLALPPSAPLLEGAGSPVLLSPDGHTLVYRTQAVGSSMLYRRGFDQLVPAAIAGTEGAVLPFLSPDGRWVAFFAEGQLKKSPISGGPAATIATVSQPHGASWGPNNIIVLGAYPGADGLSRASATGGAPNPLTKPDSAKGELSQRWPRILADGKTVLYTSWGSGGLQTARIGIASLETGESTILEVAGSYPLGVLEGHLIYARADGALMAAPLDLRRRRVTGDAVTVVDGVTIAASGASKSTLSETGALAYLTGEGTLRLVLVGANGGARPLLSEPRAYESPRFSPDGGRIAVAVFHARPPDIWVYDIGAGTLARLTSEGANQRPEWTPDGRRVVFVSNRSGENGIWWRAADGSAPPRKVFESRDEAQEVVVAPDGRVLVYRLNQTGGSYGVWYRSLDDMTPNPFVSTASYNELMPSLSPDGRWLAHVSDETGAMEVYVRPFPGPGPLYPVSAGGGSEPRWAPDGRRLFYRNGRQMLAARVTTVPAFAVTGREVLFEGNYSAGSSHQNYDVTPDGREFLMLQPTAAVEVVVVLNWLTELRARIRAKARK